MPLDPKERYEDENEAARTDLEAKQSDMWTALPVIIRKHNVDANTVEADPTIKAQKVKSDGTTEWVHITKLLDAPIHFPNGGGATITLPVKDGDEGLAVFASRSIDKWWKNGGIQDQPHFRMHDMSDGFIIPGVRSQPRVLKNVNPDTLQIRNEKGDSYFEFNPAYTPPTAVYSTSQPTLTATIQSGIILNSWAGGIAHAAGIALPALPGVGNILHTALNGIAHAAGTAIPAVPSPGDIIHTALNGILHAAGITVPQLPSPGDIIHKALSDITHTAGSNILHQAVDAITHTAGSNILHQAGANILHQAVDTITHAAGTNWTANASVTATLGGIATVRVNAGSSASIREMEPRFLDGVSINLNSPIVQVSGNLKVFGSVDASGGFFHNGVPVTGGGGGGGGDGVGNIFYIQMATDVLVLAFDFTTVDLVTPTVDDGSDTLLEHLEIGQATIVPGVYDFAIFSGPASAPIKKIYQFSLDFGNLVNLNNNYVASFRFVLPHSIFLPHSFSNTNKWCIRFYNQLPDRTTLGVQAIYTTILAHAEQLPIYQDPPPYSGPLFNDVYVGPDRTLNWDDQYTEPRYAMSAIADGGTMHIDAGTYYLPFGISHPGDELDTHPFFGPNAAQASIGGASRFTLGINIIGSGSLGPFGTGRTIFNGRGGIGNGVRLALGKGFVENRCPGSVQHIQFVGGGGADGIGDAECGLYTEGFLSPGVMHVYKCAFDNNENGMFSPQFSTGHQNVTMLLDQCDFGYEMPNGITPDGESHDFYLSSEFTIVQNCNFYGSGANCMKSRSIHLHGLNNYVRHKGARCIDYPNGGDLFMDSCIFDQSRDANINFLAYSNEGLLNPSSDPTFNNCELRISRYDTRIWCDIRAGPTRKFVFTGTTVNYYQLNWSHAYITPNRDNGGAPDYTCVEGITVFDPGLGPYPDEPTAPSPVSYPGLPPPSF